MSPDASGAVVPADDADADRARRALAAVWRIESARIVATLTRFVGDVGQAEDLAQEAMLEAMRQWPVEGVPRNGGAWLTAVAKRRAIDGWRRRERLDERYAAMARDLEEEERAASGTFWDPDTIDDDVLRLVFVACHPVLSREAQIALTLRIVGGLSSEEIARAFLVPVATIQQRIVRAKKTLAAANVPFEVPEPQDYAARLGSVLSVLYLIFNEGYLPASGEQWVRPDVSAEALRLARVVAGLMPREPEAQSLVALMEFHASRFSTRVARDGTPIPLDQQDRTRWDRAQIERGRAALARADRIGRGRAAYGLQAAIAECHAVAPSAEDTDWARIVVLYEALGRIAPSPVVELNRAVAVAMATGPASALRLVDELERNGRLAGYPGLPAVRGELLARLGRTERGARRARDRRAAHGQRAGARGAAREGGGAPPLVASPPGEPRERLMAPRRGAVTGHRLDLLEHAGARSAVDLPTAFALEVVGVGGGDMLRDERHVVHHGLRIRVDLDHRDLVRLGVVIRLERQQPRLVRLDDGVAEVHEVLLERLELSGLHRVRPDEDEWCGHDLLLRALPHSDRRSGHVQARPGRVGVASADRAEPRRPHGQFFPSGPTPSSGHASPSWSGG